MAFIQLDAHATERSTYIVDVAFRDEDGAAVVPTSATWTLTDDTGTAINTREDETITPAAEVAIVLSGADLAVAGVVGVTRILTVEAVYTSDLGADLPLKQEIRFTIDPLVAVA